MSKLVLPYLDLSSELCMMCLHLCSAQQTAFCQQHDVQSNPSLVDIDCSPDAKEGQNLSPWRQQMEISKLTAYITHLQCYATYVSFALQTVLQAMREAS